MRMVDLIEKKRDGSALSRAEINFIINGFTKGEIPDYQMSAWAMAVFYQGMTYRETVDLTAAMVESGDGLDLSALSGTVVDKHSTGGVGDKTTLVLGPAVAACGVPVAKMSGRGLGHTGGTIDKLAAIPGFKTELTEKDFIKQVKDIGLAVIAQTGNLVPADKKLYALRDVTATVNSLPLIASSVMSKKIAAGAQGIVLDVKYGAGAFMKTLEDARLLARTMVEIGKSLNRKTVAVLSDMDEPLGKTVGNSLEVMEAMDVLQGKGPDDLTEVCLELGTQMLRVGGYTTGPHKGREALRRVIESGAAWDKFLEFVAAQGGDAEKTAKRQFPLAAWRVPFLARQAGYVQAVDAYRIGRVSMVLGAGRETKESGIDPGAGLIINKKTGEWAEAGEPLAYLYSNERQKIETGCRLIETAFVLEQDKGEIINKHKIAEIVS